MGIKEKLREQAARRKKVVAANLPEDWEGRGDIFVRKLTVAERDHFEDSRVQIKTVYLPGDKRQTESRPQLQNLRARLLVKCLSDAAGQRVYRDDDAEAVGEMLDGETGDALFEQAMEFNGLMPGRAEEKNASASRSDNASGSPCSSGSGTLTASAN